MAGIFRLIGIISSAFDRQKHFKDFIKTAFVLRLQKHSNRLAILGFSFPFLVCFLRRSWFQLKCTSWVEVIDLRKADMVILSKKVNCIFPDGRWIAMWVSVWYLYEFSQKYFNSIDDLRESKNINVFC